MFLRVIEFFFLKDKNNIVIIIIMNLNNYCIIIFYTNKSFYITYDSYQLNNLDCVIKIFNELVDIYKNNENIELIQLRTPKIIKNYYCYGSKKKLMLIVHNQNVRNNMLMNWYKNEQPIELIDDIWYVIKQFIGVSFNNDWSINKPLKQLISLMDITINKNNCLSTNELTKISKYKKKYIDNKTINIDQRKYSIIFLINKFNM